MILLGNEKNSENGAPLVSVIVPVYNVRPYLEEAVNSVIHQTYANLEIILVDDGSKDGSGEICDRYAKSDSRIRVIHQTNQGLSAARNAGLDAMHGEYVAFLDSDDAFLPQMVEKLLHEMEPQSADLAVCSYARCFTESCLDTAKSIKVRQQSIQGVHDQKHYLWAVAEGRIDACVWNKLYRAELWKEVRFPVGYVHEDKAIVWLIAVRIRQYVSTPDLLYLHRKHKGSITTTMSGKNFRDWLIAYQTYSSFVEQHTPELFSERQLLISQQIALEKILYRYLHQPLKEMGPEEKARIRKWILNLGNITHGRGRGLRVWFGWHVFRFSPRLLRTLYALYYAVYANHLERLSR